MKDEKEQVEIFEEEEILAFTDEEGNEIKLCQIACVEHDGEFYSLLENYDESDEDEEEDDEGEEGAETAGGVCSLYFIFVVFCI